LNVLLNKLSFLSYLTVLASVPLVTASSSEGTASRSGTVPRDTWTGSTHRFGSGIAARSPRLPREHYCNKQSLSVTFDHHFLTLIPLSGFGTTYFHHVVIKIGEEFDGPAVSAFRRAAAESISSSSVLRNGR
jgi:hypothetical protein